MKVISSLSEVKEKYKNASIAIGVFDGLHKGHQALINQAVQKAKSEKGEALVMTFWPHPVKVLKPKLKLEYITTLKHRLKLIEKLGVAACVVVKFTKRFSHLSPQKFVKNYLVDHLGAKHVFVGDDFRFGENRMGTLDVFKELGEKYGFEVDVLKSIQGIDHKISSTDVRSATKNGELKRCEKYLGRPVSLMGEVVKGDGRGKTIGFPTINIIPEELVLPPNGVYAVYVCIGEKRYPAMANVGLRPSFKAKKKSVNVECHIFDFKKNIYGKEVVVEFIKKIREEKAFTRVEDLVKAIKGDEKKVRLILK